MNAITVTKDSYIYWTRNTPMTRLSSTAKCIIYSDAIGAVRGIWKGIGRAIGNLVFGPGGAVLTITGPVVTNAAIASVDAAIVEGLLQI